MPRFDPTEFGRLLSRLTPQELRQAEGMVAEARERAEAVLEIDAAQKHLKGFWLECELGRLILQTLGAAEAASL